ncbi:MAG: glycosyltransferase family 4 protein [Patescibacteria group bacterium]|nr:glycosyltransferase family 4 protein [Patescibacteria group bacterium]
MKIGIDVRSMIGQKAGTGYYIYGLLLGLDQIDRENEYYLYANQEFEIELNNLKIQKKIIKIPSIFWHLFTIFDIFSNRLDLYHSTHSWIIPSIIGVKTVTTIHDASSILFGDTHSLKIKTIARLLFKFGAARTRMILTPSYAAKKDIVEITKIPEKKVVVTYEAVDDNYKPSSQDEVIKIRQKYQLPEGFILYNATLEPRKNAVRLIRAYHQIRKKYGVENALVMVGKKGWLYEEIFGLVKSLGLEKDIIFTGWVSDQDLPAIYTAASLLAYPSLFEGFGLSILKAFACGTPVVTSNVSSFPEVAGDAAILVDPCDTNALAEALWRIISDKKLTKELRQKGLDQVKKFSWEKMAKETLEVYKEVRFF